MPAYLISPWIKSDIQQWSLLAKPQYLTNVEDGTILFNRREFIKHIYIVKEGRVALSAWSRHGPEHIFMIVESGGVFGEQNLFSGEKIQLYAATAKTDCALYRVPISAVEKEIRTDPLLASYMIRALCKKLDILEIQILDLAFGTVRQRVASELLFYAASHGKQTGEGILIDLTVTHQNICDRVNASRMSVSKALNQFINDGIVSKRGKYYTIKNTMELQRIIEG